MTLLAMRICPYKNPYCSRFSELTFISFLSIIGEDSTSNDLLGINFLSIFVTVLYFETLDEVQYSFIYVFLSDLISTETSSIHYTFCQVCIFEMVAF